MNAEIIGIGSELLLGQIANIDAQYISQELSQLGINVYYHTVVGDNRNRILEALDVAWNRVDMIITTGGLGPTMDDLTKEMVAEYLGLELFPHEPSIEAIKKFFKEINKPFTENNLKQGMFPKGAMVLPNDKGTAPGAIIEHGGKIFVILPGPPHELTHMFKKYVIPYFAKKSHDRISSRVLKIFGVGESMVEEKIKDLLIKQSNPTIAPLAGSGEVTLRITAKCSQNTNPLTLIKPVEDEIRRRLGDAIYGVDDDTLESAVIRLLNENNKTVAIAESCTGGLICSRLTNVPGASQGFVEGVVAYSNETKMKRLGVSSETLGKYGAVSCECAHEMVKGIMDITHADIGLSVTGIAGPSGGTPEKPVGLVYIGMGNKNGITVKRFELKGDRKKIRYTTSNLALDWLRRILISGEF